MIGKLILFLTINFSALALGGIFTSRGVPSEWYAELSKAPWTPPGWVFGFAWTIIMICFAVYMASLWPLAENKKLLVSLFTLQWILNVAWNPVFFYFHHTGFALLIIILLTVLIGYMLFFYWSSLNLRSTFLLPYFFWLLLATSLNAFIVLKNYGV